MSHIITIVLADDGRHVTVGRFTQPTEEEIRLSETALSLQGLGGWLCNMTGAYYTKQPVQLENIRTLGKPGVDFVTARAKFIALRDRNVSR